jgi:NAD(P)-dependent dehydrogenase (short-subunit alcohol dehydrogenase family)
VSAHFAAEGAEVAILYLNEDRDAKEISEFILSEFGRECELIKADIRNEQKCRDAVRKTIKRFGQIDVLVNNAAVQYPAGKIGDITKTQLYKTFETNIFSMFYLSSAALPSMRAGSCIVNTSSVTAYRGSGHLLDYSATKGAIVSFTRSLSAALADRKIRVNAVAPGPIWTPLIPASFPPKHVATFGSDVPLKRAGQPAEVAPAYVYLASDDSIYVTGQVIHVNGGEIVNG